ncbi:HAAS domain-containing protein [Sutcliffiella horikoshii]|uniref:HAAS domain-containing protein n=1 Tax=Sutcliffiella horikoshii TaxID=79883 RepID=UPI003CE83D24
MNQLPLSKKSQTFIENLRVYLFSCGKKTNEIDEITDELEVHLYEAEKENKSVEHIIGNSPKEYMEQISGEMSFDVRGWAKYVPIIILGAFSGIVLKDIVFGGFQYSLVELIGYPLVCIVLLLAYMWTFRHISSHNFSKAKEFFFFGSASFLSMALFLGLMFLPNYIDSPIIMLGYYGNLIVASLAITFLIGISIWSKTIVSIVLPFFYIVPEYLVGFTVLSAGNQLWISSIIMYALIGAYLFFEIKRTSPSSEK